MEVKDIIFIVISSIFLVISIYQQLLIISYRKNAELIESVKERLYQVSEKLIKAKDQDEIYSLILETAVDLIPNAEKGSVLLLDKDDLFGFQSVKGFTQDLTKLKFKKEEAYLYHINKFKETAIIVDPRKFDDNFLEKKTKNFLSKRGALDISCTISAPLYIDDKLIGLLNVDSHKKGYVFSRKELNLMNLIKSELQIAIKSAFNQSKLKYMASYDELTGLMNRRSLDKSLNQELERIKRNDETISLVLLDIDQFKYINDTYGHNIGDKVLKYFSIILQECIRKSDLIFRMSGDEFVIIFRSCNMEMAVERMENIKNIILSKKIENIKLAFSYGICECKGSDTLTGEAIMMLADNRMYKNKGSKKLS